MLKSISKLFFILVTLLLVTGCALIESPTEIPNNDMDIQDVTVDDLENTEHFRPGALEHILEGEINRKGDAVGFHYEGLESAKGTVIESTRTAPDKYGVYEAEVEVEGVKKSGNRGISSFFPLHWTAQEVVDGINEAYESKEFIRGNTYEGISHEGVIIHMYLDQKDKIISAFPVL